MIGSAMGRSVPALLGLLLVATACGGEGGTGSGARVKLFDLSIWGDNSGGTDREFRGTCPPGRLTVAYRPGDEITIKSKSRLVASLSATEAFIGCSDARVLRPKPHQGRAFVVRRVVQVKHSTKLLCVTDKRIEIIVTAAYKFHDTFAGGSIIVSTPRAHHQRRGRALVLSSVTDGEDSTLSYHTRRCHLDGRG
jgi:hypothetical protein